LNSILQSTLECLYDQQCVHLLTNVFNISQSFSPIDNHTNASCFSSNATLYSIVNQLFIENWQTNISYLINSFSQVVYVLTILIGLYGGLNISLK